MGTGTTKLKKWGGGELKKKTFFTWMNEERKKYNLIKQNNGLGKRKEQRKRKETEKRAGTTHTYQQPMQFLIWQTFFTLLSLSC
jgi:hypothetical protein